MVKRFLSFAAGAVLVFSSAPTRGQERPDPEPAQIMKAMHEAMLAAGTLRADAVRVGLGAMASRTPSAAGTIVLERLEGDPLGWKFAVRGELSPYAEHTPSRFHVAYDGGTVRSVVDEPREFVESPSAGAGDLLKPGGSWLISWLMRWQDFVVEPFVDGATNLSPFYDGRATVDGVECHVIRLDLTGVQSVDEYIGWWFVGADDHLPRRFDWLYYGDGVTGDGMASLTLSNLRAGEPVEPGEFTPAPPEGHALRRHTPKESDRALAAAPRSAVDTQAPDWTLKDPAGGEHTLSKLRGSVVVMDFWATWCVPCTMAMPHVQRLHERFAGRPVRVFGVNCWENADAAAYMAKHKYTYTLLLDGDDAAQAYDVNGIPAFFIIGVDGRILHTAVGFSPDHAEKFAAIIDEHLKAHGK